MPAYTVRTLDYALLLAQVRAERGDSVVVQPYQGDRWAAWEVVTERAPLVIQHGAEKFNPNEWRVQP